MLDPQNVGWRPGQGQRRRGDGQDRWLLAHGAQRQTPSHGAANDRDRRDRGEFHCVAFNLTANRCDATYVFQP